VKWTEQEEQLLRDLHERTSTQGGKKELEFEKLASQIGRSSVAISKKYYNVFPVGVGNKKSKAPVEEVKVDEVLEVERIDERVQQSSGRHDKILWTEQSVDILKQELLNQIKNKVPNVRTYETLAERLNMGFSTICSKIYKMRLKLNVDTNLKLYNALVAGVSLELLNDDTILKKIKKQKSNLEKKQQKKIVEQNSVSNIKQVVSEPIEKRSFLQLFNPFYPMIKKIKKLEKEIEHLKSKLK
jgi:hypothetical protein